MELKSARSSKLIEQAMSCRECKKGLGEDFSFFECSHKCKEAYCRQCGKSFIQLFLLVALNDKYPEREEVLSLLMCNYGHAMHKHNAP